METFVSKQENFHKIKYKSHRNKKIYYYLSIFYNLEIYVNYRRITYFEVTDLRKTCNLKLI